MAILMPSDPLVFQVSIESLPSPIMDSVVGVMKKVAEQEARKIYKIELGIVTAVFSHSSKSDKDNYQCSIKLKN